MVGRAQGLLSSRPSLRARPGSGGGVSGDRGVEGALRMEGDRGWQGSEVLVGRRVEEETAETPRLLRLGVIQHLKEVCVWVSVSGDLTGQKHRSILKDREF